MKLNIPTIITITFDHEEIIALQKAYTILDNMIDKLDEANRTRYASSIYSINRDTLDDIAGYLSNIVEMVNMEEIQLT